MTRQIQELIAQNNRRQDADKGHDGPEKPAFKPRPSLKDIDTSSIR